MFPHETSQFGKLVKVLIQNLFIYWLGWKMYYKVKISGVFEHFWLVEKLPENQGLFFFLINSISDSVVLTSDAKVIFTWFYLYNWISRIVVLQKWTWSFLRERVKREISEAVQTAEKIQTNLVKKSVKRHYQVKKLFLNIFECFGSNPRNFQYFSNEKSSVLIKRSIWIYDITNKHNDIFYFSTWLLSSLRSP